MMMILMMNGGDYNDDDNDEDNHDDNGDDDCDDCHIDDDNNLCNSIDNTSR